MSRNNRNLSADELYDGIGHVNKEWILIADDPMEIQKAAMESTQSKKQKRFVMYEIKKLCGVKYLWVFLFVLLMLNTLVAWYTADKTVAAQEPTQMISEFYAEYFENPEELDAYYAEMQAFNAEQEELFREAMRQGDYDFQTESLPNLYSTDENYSDPDAVLKALHDHSGGAGIPRCACPSDRARLGKSGRVCRHGHHRGFLRLPLPAPCDRAV